MVAPTEHGNSRTPFSVQIMLCAVSVVVLIALMYYSATYPYPSGKPPGVVSFVFFWLREIIILAIVAVCLLIGLAGWVAQFVRRLRVKGKNAP